MTNEQREAVEEWIRQLDPPTCTHDTLRRKFGRLNLTVEEIRTDMNAKMARRVNNVR
jgi:hypothetical protein